MLGQGCRGEIIASGCNISYRCLHLNEGFQNTNVTILMALLLAFKHYFTVSLVGPVDICTHGGGGGPVCNKCRRRGGNLTCVPFPRRFSPAAVIRTSPAVKRSRDMKSSAVRSHYSAADTR